VDRSRRKITLWVLVGALVPPALAYLGYVAAGAPHVDCGDAERTQAFYRVALPVFGFAGLVGVAALVQIAGTHSEPKRHWITGALAVLAALLALDAFLPGGLHDPAAAVVIVLGLAAIVGGILTAPVTIGLAAFSGISLYRGRHRGAPDRKERRIHLLLVGWVLLAALPALIVGVSLNADPICFSF
jgi:hypothetical protein